MSRPSGDDLAIRVNSVAVHLVRRAATADRDLGVPPGQLSALSVLVFGGARSLTALADAERVASPTMTRIVDGLERAGLAERQPDPSDRRASIVRATAKGRRVMLRGRDGRVRVLDAVLAAVPARDRSSVARAVDALSRALAVTSDREG